MSTSPEMWRSDWSVLLDQAIRGRSGLLALGGELTRSEDPSTMLQPPDGDVPRTRSRRVSVRASDRDLTYCESGRAQLPRVDDPGPGWNAAEMSEAPGVELADHAGVHEAEYDLAQLGCLLIDPQYAGDVRHLAARYRLEGDTDLPITVRLAYQSEAMRRGKLLRQQHRFVRGVIMPARLGGPRNITIKNESRGIDRAEGSLRGDRKDVAVRPEHGPIVIELRLVNASLTDTQEVFRGKLAGSKRLVYFVPNGRERRGTRVVPPARGLRVDDDALENYARAFNVQRELAFARERHGPRHEGQVSDAPHANAVNPGRGAKNPGA